VFVLPGASESRIFTGISFMKKSTLALILNGSYEGLHFELEMAFRDYQVRNR